MLISKVGHATSGDELYAAAEALVPLLRQQNAETETRRWIGDDLSRRLNEAGMYHLFGPARYGGAELSTRDGLRVLAKIAEGCPSASWVAGIHNAAVWLAALYADQTQEDVFNGREPAVVSGVLSPHGRLEPTDGGYHITGKWGFASGVLDANWMLMGAERFDGSGIKIDDVYALVPTAEINIFDDWNVMGLAGTGSHSVAVNGVFVPAHRIIDPVAAARGDIPSEYARNVPLFRAAFLPLLSSVLVTPAIGAARAMLEAFITQVHKRRIAYTIYDHQAESVVTQTKLAEAAMLIDEAEYHVERLAEDMDRCAASGEYMSFDNRARARMDIGRALDLCRSAANLLFSLSGGAGVALSNPIQRYFRDIQVANVHALQLPTVQYEIYGRLLLGQPQITALI